MGYFDNPDKRAAWEKELVGIRAEKARRTGEPVAAPSQMQEKTDSVIKQISYMQLYEKEFGKQTEAPSLSRSVHQMELSKTKEAGGRTL